MSLEKILEVARGEIGYLEKKSNSQLDDKTANAGSNNYNKYARDIWSSLQAQPWCDIFVSWCAAQAGEAAAVGKYAYVPSHVQFFKSKEQYFARGAKTPQTGDIIFFQNESHVGLVESVTGSTVTTIEGNTSGGSSLVANGGGVFRKTYSLSSSSIQGYGRPAYSSGGTGATTVATQSPITAVNKATWKKNATGWWYEYADGSYPVDGWQYIDDQWYFFDDKGYVVADTVVEAEGKIYTFDSNGHVTVTDAVVDGATENTAGDNPAEEIEVRYNKLSEVTSEHYRPTLDKLIEKGYLKGKGGEGDDMIIDFSEDTVRTLVILDRAGAFDK